MGINNKIDILIIEEFLSLVVCNNIHETTYDLQNDV